MRREELYYHLPPELIAQCPADRRDESRLLVVDRASRWFAHHQFRELPELLPPQALLVLNDTRVIPARVLLRRTSGGRLEGLFLSEPSPGEWEILLTGSRRLKAGERLVFEPGQAHRNVAGVAEAGLRLIEPIEPGTWRAQPDPPAQTLALLERVGHVPLPPYIRREREHDTGRPADIADERLEALDHERYQTVYAETPGAVAAPTAGLHFTPELFNRLAEAGIETTRLTLHVGAGTFMPIRSEDLASHEMHEEYYRLPPATAEAINHARDRGRPIVAVGTTSVRVLETCADDTGRVRAGEGRTRLFIYPPYRYKVVDALITNFHLPESTLLAMIFAFADRSLVLDAYAQAIRQRFRFYSYGDAMLIR